MLVREDRGAASDRDHGAGSRDRDKPPGHSSPEREDEPIIAGFRHASYWYVDVLVEDDRGDAHERHDGSTVVTLMIRSVVAVPLGVRPRADGCPVPALV